MANSPLPELGELLAAFGISAIETQRALDLHHNRNRAAEEPSLSVSNSTFVAKGNIRRTCSTAHSLAVQLANLGGQILHGTSLESQSEIQLTIEQVPAPIHPSARN